jgi:hypothetical protein
VNSGVSTASVLIGIDDTDNISSRGTGFLVQRLIVALEDEALGRARGATRHQLLVDPRIPYTSHNSSACIAWAAGREPPVEAIAQFCGAFLASESAPGSDPGLVVAPRRSCVPPETQAALVDFGHRAKSDVLDLSAAWSLAARSGIHASGHGGDHGGVIGALAAVGLHLSGEDGFFLWMPGIRMLLGDATYADLRAAIPIDVARDAQRREPGPEDRIHLGDWVRPILSDGQAVLLLESCRREGILWAVAPREVVRTH